MSPHIRKNNPFLQFKENWGNWLVDPRNWDGASVVQEGMEKLTNYTNYIQFAYLEREASFLSSWVTHTMAINLERNTEHCHLPMTWIEIYKQACTLHNVQEVPIVLH